MLFFLKLNALSYDKSNIYVINYKGKFIYPKNDFKKVVPVINGISLYWLYLNSEKRKYLFYLGNMNVFSSFNSEEVAKNITEEISQSGFK